MDVPQYALDAAMSFAAGFGGDANMVDAFLKGFALGNKNRKKGGTLKPITDEYTFSRWWDLYDNKIDREKCEVKWHNVLTYEERKAATEHTPLYVASTPDKKWRKHPYTYLNNKSWKNEVQGAGAVQLEEANADAFMEYFNNMFEETKIPKITEMTVERRQALNYIYTFYKNDIIPVLNKVLNSTYLRGEDGRNGRTCFDQIFTQNFFLKIKEGNFDD